MAKSGGDQVSKVLHIVPGLEDVANGMATVAQMLAKEQGDANVVDLREGMRAIEEDETVEEVWVHGLWLPGIWRACLKALRLGKRLVRMPHGSLSPVYLQHQSRLKKRLALPIERYLLNKAHKVVATCAAEKEWILKYAPQVKQTEVTDLKRFFDFGNMEPPSPRLRRSRQGLGNREPAHLLYLGRKHPLKGWEYLERAVKGIKGVELRIVDKVAGADKARAWEWCDVLVLPTLSENFGLVIAEALARGKRVITTDGAPAWANAGDYGGRLKVIDGFVTATPEARVAKLAAAIGDIKAQAGARK